VKRVKLVSSDMDALLERLETKMREWNPETAEDVRQRVAEIIELADENALDLSRSRVVEQEALDLLDEPASR
jgi:hypothetical protein